MRDQIFTISEFYQAIGFLNGNHELDDVNDGVNLIENSPYIQLSDRRRAVEGELQGMLNSAISDPQGTIFYTRRGEALWRNELDVFPEVHDAFFYGELVGKIERVVGGWHLVFAVDDVVVGYPEHVVAGQPILRMNFDLEEGNELAILDLEVGERYFLRGMLAPGRRPMIPEPDWLDWLEGYSPTVGSEDDALIMQPLYPDGLWYIHVPHEETLDFTLPELALILEEIEFLHHNHHAVQLRTTRGMMLMPIMLDMAEMGFMVDGRPIDYEDHLYANPVAAIHAGFAHIRDLSIGDILTVNVPKIHHAEYRHHIEWWMTTPGATRGNQSFTDARVESAQQIEALHEIELEIVGIYNLFRGLGMGGDWNTTFTTHIYIPDSVLPDDIVISSDRWRSPAGQNYLPSTWYSFRLRSSRDEVAFIAENRQPLEELGLTVTMITSAQHFWDSADVILQSITFNGIVFSVVLILVLLLVVFLFLRQRRKEIIVSRLLGCSVNRSIREVLQASGLFFIPISLGSIAAWIFARGTIINTLQTFEELHEGFEATFSLSIFWLIGMMILVFILTMVMVFIGASKLGRQPVLELLHRKD